MFEMRGVCGSRVSYLPGSSFLDENGKPCVWFREIQGRVGGVGECCSYFSLFFLVVFPLGCQLLYIAYNVCAQLK